VQFFGKLTETLQWVRYFLKASRDLTMDRFV
jgi:hypothetical protein